MSYNKLHKTLEVNARQYRGALLPVRFTSKKNQLKYGPTKVALPSDQSFTILENSLLTKKMILLLKVSLVRISLVVLFYPSESCISTKRNASKWKDSR